MSRIAAVALAALVTMATLSVAAVGGAAGAAQPSESHATTAQNATADGYVGTHVAFETSSDAIVDYRVDNETVFENVTVASRSDHQSRTGLGADAELSTVVDLPGLGLELSAQSQTRADVATDGSASLSAHDTERGILTVDAGEDAQYVELNLSEESNATAEDEGDRVLVETENRTGALVVAGDGAVAVNDDGDVTADLGSESTLVFRSYENGERDENAREQERLIAEGTATAEVYADAVDGERVVDVATYGHDTAVETGAEAEDRLEMSVERAESEGKIVIVSVSEAALEAVGSAEDLAVTVDGEAAAEASSYGELEGGIGEEPRYMVTASSDAEAAADVLVAVDHFSERDVAIQSADDVESGDGDGGGDSVPGFGAVAALVAALIGIGARLRR